MVFEVCVDFRMCDLFSPPAPPSDPKDSESKWPADCPFALSPRSKPKGPVTTAPLSWRPHTYSGSTHTTICAPSSDCLAGLTSTNCTCISPPLLESDEFCYESPRLEGILPLDLCSYLTASLCYWFMMNVSCRKAENVDRRSCVGIYLH